MPFIFPALDSADATDAGQRVPITVLTGFLGSGKTTLLNRLLRQPDMHGTAVVINEFGAVGLDHDLVDHTDEQMVLLANGCICCTVRGDLVEAFERLAQSPQAQRGELRHVVVETTGLADPAPILHTLMGDPRLARQWRLAGVACTIDAFNAMATLDRHREAVKQAAVADHLLLTKTDLVADAMLAPLLERLQGINPLSTVARGPDAALQALVGLLSRPSAARSSLPADEERSFFFPVSGPAQHDPSRHDDQIRSHVIVREQPLSREGFMAWLDMLSSLRGNDLLRVKGIVQLADDPEHPMVIHGVQHLFHPPETLARWPSEDRRTRIVFITRNIDAEDIEATLSVFERRSRRDRRPAQPV
ncbi:CobW family GTP-binding protein [Hydrogenophaga sp. OTU3427]|uniref:CobW family GTP-binding protein n=1 Tax=Hydrogenophaga sp. OTU3427 TaxID=3043856 RepID=UPI00313B8712